MKRVASASKVGLIIVIMGFAACTPSSPDFFPNEKFQRASAAERIADEQYCMSLANEYVKEPNKYWEAAKQGTVGAAIGAGTGAVAGSIFSNAGRATGAGAAVGGMLGVLRAISQTSDHSPSKQRFVEHCLQKKGYEITGWSSK